MKSCKNMEEFAVGSGNASSRNVSSQNVGFIHDRKSYEDSMEHLSPGITITSDSVQVEIKFRQRVGENREKFFASNAMEEPMVPEMLSPRKNSCELREENDVEGFREDYVNFGNSDDDEDNQQANENNEIRFEEYPMDESYDLGVEELVIEPNEEDANYDQDLSACPSEFERFNSHYSDDKKVGLDNPSGTDNTSEAPVFTSTGQPELDELVRKILRCDLCPQLKLTTFNESFAHHQHFHGLMFCPVCFVLVNCHDEFMKEHLKSSHLINDDGDVHCPLCSITIHHILCFDHIKKDHLREYFEQYETKPKVHHMNAPLVQPPRFFRIPYISQLRSVTNANNVDSIASELGSRKGEGRESLNQAGVLNRCNTQNIQTSSTFDVIQENKRMRNKLADEQVEILDEFFEKNKHPSLVDKLDLARACNLSVHTISAWFGNRRRLRIDWDKLSDEKRTRLLTAYENNTRPTHAEIDLLCQELGLNHTQVSAWFKTRLQNQQNLRKRLKPKYYLSAKRRVTEMLKAKLESSDSDSSLSGGASVKKPFMNNLDNQRQGPLPPSCVSDRVCTSQPLGVTEKLMKVQDWINHYVDNSFSAPTSPVQLLEPDSPDPSTRINQTSAQGPSGSKPFAIPSIFGSHSSVNKGKSVEKIVQKPTTVYQRRRSPSPPVLTRPCSPPFEINDIIDREPAKLTRSVPPAHRRTEQPSKFLQQQLKQILQPGQQFSFETKQILRECFRSKQYLSDKEKKSLAEQVGATPHRISNWFQLERSHLRSFLNDCRDLNSQRRGDLLGKHRRLENINLEDVYDKCLNYFVRENFFSNSQELKLVKKFAENMHPDVSQVALIAKEVGASREKVSQWFTNRFQRLRRGKLPGYDLKGGVLIRLGTDQTYSEIKIEPQEIRNSHNNSENNSSPVKKQVGQVVPTLKWDRTKATPPSDVEQRGSSQIANLKTQQSMLCLKSIIDRDKLLVLNVRKLPISPGTIVKVKDSELDMFDRTYSLHLKNQTKPARADKENASNQNNSNPSPYKTPRKKQSSLSKSRNSPATSSSAHSTKSSNPRHFSPQQKKLLEENFEKNMFPTGADLKALAKKLDLNELQVNRWFAYQRFTERNKKENGDKIVSKWVTSKKSKRRRSVETSRRVQRPRPKYKLTNRCTGFLQSQRDILWDSFEECDYPDQDSIDKLAKKSGLSAVQIDQWFRQQRYKKRHGKGVFQIPSSNSSNQIKVDNENRQSETSADVKPDLQDIKLKGSMINSSAEIASGSENYVGVRTRRNTSAYQANCTNMDPASFVKVEMKIEEDSESLRSTSVSLSNALNKEPSLSELPSPVQKSREHSQYRKTYAGRKQTQKSNAAKYTTEIEGSTAETIDKLPKYNNSTVLLPESLVQRFNSIRALKVPIFQKKISKVSLKFDDLVEIYVECDEDSKKWISEESSTLKDIIELHEKSSLVFTCDQEEILIERRLKILNDLLKKRPSDKIWCSTVNSFHLENVFRTWYFLGVYCALSSISLGEGIADFSSKLNVLKGPVSPAAWLIPPVLEP